MQREINKKPRTFYWAGYVRKSTEEEGRRSLGNQAALLQRAMERIIRTDPFGNRYEFRELYCDEDRTGTDSQRPAFQRLLRDLGTGRVNLLIVPDLSRLSRNLSESIQYVQGLFVALDVRFISLRLPALDSYLEPDGIYQLEVPMQSVMNEAHCKDTSFKVRDALDRLRQDGQFIGAFAGYGFQKDPRDRHRLLVDEEAAAVIRRIGAWLLSGDSASSVAQKLNRLGIPNPTAYKNSKGLLLCIRGQAHPSPYWSAHTVRYVMTRPELTGTLIQGRYRIKSYKVHQQLHVPPEEWYVSEHRIPPLFAPEEFERIQACLQRRTRAVPRDRAAGPTLFSGFLRCYDCQKGMSRKTSKGYVYYVCSSHKNYQTCSRHSIAHGPLERAVFETVRQYVAAFACPADVVQQVRCAPSPPPVSLDALIQAREKELTKLRRLQRLLYEDWKAGELTKEEYRWMKADYSQREAETIKRLASLSSEQQAARPSEQRSAVSYYATHGTLETLTRAVLSALVDTIAIHEGKRITLQFKCASPFPS